MKLAFLEANAARAALELEHVTHELAALEAAATEAEEGPVKEAFKASIAELAAHKALLEPAAAAWQKALDKEPKPEKVDAPAPELEPAIAAPRKRQPKPPKAPDVVTCCKCKTDITHAPRTLGRDAEEPTKAGFWCVPCRKART